MIAFANEKFNNFLTMLESRSGFNPVEKFLQRTIENKAKLRYGYLSYFWKILLQFDCDTGDLQFLVHDSFHTS